jgi:hypothetical protein
MQLVTGFLGKPNQTQHLVTLNVIRITQNFNMGSDEAKSEFSAVKTQDLGSKMTCTQVSKIGVSHNSLNDIYEVYVGPQHAL